MVFAGYSGFPHYLQLASHELATIGINVTKKRNSKFKSSITALSHFGNPKHSQSVSYAHTVIGLSLHIHFFIHLSLDLEKDNLW